MVFHWQTSRAAACLDHNLPADFSGTLQCDGYRAYPAFVHRQPQPITLSGCWAHARRAFDENREESPRRIGWLLRQIQHLYAVEKALRESSARPRLRQAVRSAQSQPVLARLTEP